MKNSIVALITAAGLLVSSVSAAGTPEWVSDWGMGVTEYSVNDGHGNEMYIACSESEGEYVRAYATINGKSYNAEEEPGFDVIVDGESHDNLFSTHCRICSESSSIFGTRLPRHVMTQRNLHTQAANC